MLKKGDTGVVKDRLWAVVDAKTGKLDSSGDAMQRIAGTAPLAVFSTRQAAKDHRDGNRELKVVRLNDFLYTVL